MANDERERRAQELNEIRLRKESSLQRRKEYVQKKKAEEIKKYGKLLPFHISGDAQPINEESFGPVKMTKRDQTVMVNNLID